MDKSFKQKQGVSLAEIIIVLVIIGVVAALTLPSFLNNYNEHQTVVRLNDTYSVLTQAVKMMIAEHGPLNEWTDESLEFFTNELVSKLKAVPEDCKNREQCSFHSYKRENEKIYILDNGSAIIFRFRNDKRSCKTSVEGIFTGKGADVDVHYNSCAGVSVDINGKKGPNTVAKDIFAFRVYTDGILPMGLPNNIGGGAWNDDFTRSCFPGSVNSNETCTGWVIYNKNMDYLHCRDKISWNGPHSCKEAR